MQRNTLNKLAFTLIELLVVIAIIGILSGLIVVAMDGMTQKANIAKSQVFSNSLRNSLLLNLVSEWKFDGITNDNSPATPNDVLDTWSGGKNGAVSATPPTVKTNCVNGSCLQFDGVNTYVTFPFYFTRAQMEVGMTWSLWVKHSISDSVAGHHYQVLTQSSYSAGSYERAGAIVISNKKACFSIFDTVSYRTPCGNGNTDDNNWHFVVATVAPGATSPNVVLTVYTDTLAGTAVNSNQGGDTGYINLRMAQANGNDANHCNYAGLIDEIRVYNAPMPVSWINEQYHLGLNNLLASGEITKEYYQNKIERLSMINSR